MRGENWAHVNEAALCAARAAHRDLIEPPVRTPAGEGGPQLDVAGIAARFGEILAAESKADCAAFARLREGDLFLA